VAPLDQLELLAHKVSKVTLERRESLAQPELWDPVDPQDLVASQEVMVKLANRARQESVAQQDLKELVDSLELLVSLESKDTEVTLVWTEPRERQELLGPRVRAELPGRMEHLDQWAHVVCLAREDVPELLDLLAPEETMVYPALLVLQDLLALLEHPVSQDPQELREKLVPPVPVVLRAHKDLAERLEPQDPRDPPELVAILELMASLEPKDLLVLLASLVPPDSQAHVDHPGLREQLDLLGPRDRAETPVCLGSKAKLDRRESLALPVPKVPQAQLERRAKEAPEESLVLLDPLDPLEREELPVTVVSLVKMVLLELREPLVTGVFLALLDPRVLAVIQVAQENLASLEPEVSPAVLEMLVPKAKLDLVVLLVRMVGRALLGPREPEVSLA